MPHRVRCPHCERGLLAGDALLGQVRPCPACGRPFRIAVAVSAAAPTSLRGPDEAEPLGAGAADAALDAELDLAAAEPSAPPPAPNPNCPRCKAELAPTAAYCHACHVDLTTGRRLPLSRRIRLLPLRYWIGAGAAIALLVVAASIALKFWLLQHPTPLSVALLPVAPPPPPPLDDYAQALLAAQTPAAQRDALAVLRGLEAQAAPAVARALAADLAADPATRPVSHRETPAAREGEAPAEPLRRQARVALPTPQQQSNRLAAIELLARNADPGVAAECLPALEPCSADPVLRSAALAARGRLADARVVAALSEQWLDQLKRVLLLSRVARAGRNEADGATNPALRRAEQELARTAEGLRTLAADPANGVFERLAEAYWESWIWLGQGPGDRFAVELFALARPAERTLAFRPEDVRGPRDVLKEVAERASPAGRAAAGLIIEQLGPQYKSVCRAIGANLITLLPGCSASDQQRLTWAAARLLGRAFGPGLHAHPLEVTEAEVAAAQLLGRPDAPPVLHAPYPEPPTLIYRATTPLRQFEDDLLAAMRRDWASADRAVNDWLAAGLGCTPRLRELLHPGQREPRHSALAAALLIVAETNDNSVRRELELWREAVEQPPWVRGLAYTVLGSLDARRGKWDSGWPANLDLGDPAVLDRGAPGWDHLGRVLARGGRAAAERLNSFKPAPLPPPVRARLLEAAKRAGQPAGGVPGR